ncbi:MAG: carboxypeptidase regulatory-like domain-containing protein [Bacteroidia bacterium]|nr:carboxypeptidase regulatory-like domain-containing protein [Bacteroidia bacterium]
MKTIRVIMLISALIFFYGKIYAQCTANASLDDEVCGNSYQLNGQVTGNGIPVWSVNTQYAVFDTSGTPDYLLGQGSAEGTHDLNAWLTLTSLALFGDTGYYTAEVVLTLQGDSCFTSDTVIITFYQKPDVFAGEDFNVCGKTTCMNADSACCGAWQPHSGIVFYEPNSPSSCLIVNIFGPMNMLWCESNSICSACDTVLVTFYQDLEAEQQVYNPEDYQDSIIPWCENTFPFLDANNYSNIQTADGFWTDVVGGTQIFSPDEHTPTCSVTVPSYGLHTFYWVLTNGEDFDVSPVCIDSSEAVKIHFYERPAANAGNDTTVCGLSTLLHATVTPGAHGQWSSPDPSAEFHFNGQMNDTSVLDSVTVGFPSYDQDPNYYEFFWMEDSGWEIPGFECSDIDTLHVIFYNNMFLNGNIFFSGGPFPAGEAKARLYIPDGNGPYSLVSEEIPDSNSAFSFPLQQEGYYYLKIVKESPGNFPHIHNTWYDSVFHWQDATPIVMECPDTISLNVNMVETVPPAPGNGGGSGNVSNEDTLKNLSVVVGAEIFLADALTDLPVAFTTTDSAGNYTFSDIPDGTYSIYIDMPGLPMINTHTFTISQTEQIWTGLNFIVHEEFITATEAESITETQGETSGLCIFPNPCKDKFEIIFSVDSKSTVNFKLLDNTGKTICILAEGAYPAGKHRSLIPIKSLNLMSGQYYLLFNAGKSVELVKFFVSK